MARNSAIRELATSNASTRIAAAFFERTVQVWDVRSGEKTTEFETVFSFGGRRLAIDASGELCIAAGWTRGRRGGVACYETRTGKLVWHRTDLGQTQQLHFSNNGTGLWRVPDIGPTIRLDILTGNTLEQIRGLKSIYESVYGDIRLLVKRQGGYILQSQKNLRLPQLDFALLSAAFAPNAVCISEPCGLARCFELSTGIERWRCDPGRGVHVVRVWYRDADDHFYGVRWEYEKGGPKALVRFQQQTGLPEELVYIDSSWQEAVSPVQDCLVTTSGSVFALSDGSLLHCLAFPQCDYPD